MLVNAKNRYQAFAIHLAISSIIVATVLSLILFIWFPYEFIKVGGLQGLKILIGVDIVLGPLLTLIVYKPGKKHLALDLTIIAIIQLSCLGAGLYQIYQERPVLQLLDDNGLHIIPQGDFREHGINFEGLKLPGDIPKFAIMDLPMDRQKASSVKFTFEFDQLLPYPLATQHYKPVSQLSTNEYNKRINFLYEHMANKDKEKIDLLEKYLETCTWVPAYSSHFQGYACVDRHEGAIKFLQ